MLERLIIKRQLNVSNKEKTEFFTGGCPLTTRSIELLYTSTRVRSQQTSMPPAGG